MLYHFELSVSCLLNNIFQVVTKLGNDANSNDAPCVSDQLLNVEATPFCSKHGEQNDQAINKHGVEMRTGFKIEEIKTGSDGSGQDKVLKKPDIIVPCPRCNSMETKFCYFNNYNVSQPRHFCRNCQRYWTAGGNIRNVPVGSGRRRNKHASHFRHAIMSCDANIAAPGDVSNEIHHLALPLLPQVLPGPIKENETVKEFGTGVPVCKSMTSVHNIEKQKDAHLVSLASDDNNEDQSCPSSSWTCFGVSLESWMEQYCCHGSCSVLNRAHSWVAKCEAWSVVGVSIDDGSSRNLHACCSLSYDATTLELYSWLA